MRVVTLPVVVFLMVVSWWGCTALPGLGPPRVEKDGVLFTLSAPGARTVAVAGSFNGWSATASPMKAVGDGRWGLMLSLPPGEHLFMYVIDSQQWLMPPLAEDFIDDGFGNRNGVVTVR